MDKGNTYFWMSNISSLGDLRRKQEGDKDKDAKKRNELFIGGLDQRGGGSGLGIIILVTHLFCMDDYLRENFYFQAVLGPPPNRPQDRSGNANGASVFDSIVGLASNQQPGDAAGDSQPREQLSRKITMYRNGFRVDDGPLRDLTSPESLEFIASLERGDVPRELQQRKPGEPRLATLDILLDDHRGEDYVPPPPPAYVAFSGQGSVLRREPTAIDNSTTVFSPELLADVEVPSVDETKPVTTVQVRTSQGKKLRIKINQDATLYQLAALVLREAGGKK